MSLTSELEALATKETNLSSQSSSGKVANFSYTDDAYQADQYEGHSDFVAGRGNNIPLATSTSLKTNQTVLNTGYREQGASIVRHLANHFFGRVSYNLNKAHDNLLSFISIIKNNLGEAGGIATLRSGETRLTASQSPYGTDIPVSDTYNSNIISYMKKLFTLPYLGRNWTQGSGATTHSFYTVYYANGIWVAGGGNSQGLWWSTDGKNWTQGSGYFHTVYTVYYANGIWVAGSAYNGVWWSTDGKNWTQSSQATTYRFDTVYYANGIWVAGSSSQGLWWSTDGKNWTQGSGATTHTVYTVYTVYYANGIWVAGSPNGLWWSTDGKNWTQGSGATTHTFDTVYYANGIWVAGSSSHGLWWSSIDNLVGFPLLDS